MSKFVDFAERLTWHRSKAGISQRELAERSGVSLPQITRYESGKSTPRLAAVMKIAAALNLDVSDFTSSRTDAGLVKVVLESPTSDRSNISLVLPDELIERIEKAAEDRSVSFDDMFHVFFGNLIKEEAIKAGRPWSKDDDRMIFGDLPHEQID